MEEKLNKSVVNFDHVYFSYGDVPVLTDVTFDVAAGDFVGIIGPNGGGKTTLLKLLMGFLTPDSGSIRLFGKGPEETRDRVGYVPQNLRYDREFPISVTEVVLSGLLSHLPWYGRFSGKDKVAAMEALDKVGMLPFKDRHIGALSGGQMQRVLIARALVSQPQLLLLDEPTANVDPQAQTDILAILKALSGDVTILMVTHDLRESINVVERIIIVQNAVTTYASKEVCEHFALGLYHAPLLFTQESADPCCQLQVKKEKDEK